MVTVVACSSKTATQPTAGIIRTIESPSESCVGLPQGTQYGSLCKDTSTVPRSDDRACEEHDGVYALLTCPNPTSTVTASKTPEPTVTIEPTTRIEATITSEADLQESEVELGPALDGATYIQQLSNYISAFDRENTNYGALVMALPDGKIRNADKTWIAKAKASNAVRLGILTELKRLNGPEEYNSLQTKVLKFAKNYEMVLYLSSQGIDNLDDTQFLLAARKAIDALVPYLEVVSTLEKIGY
jgi:hypothetical protein